MIHGEKIPDSEMRKDLVELNGIWKSFNGVAVLRGVNLDLKSGEIHALLGGNGSGKSTLMKILSGIYRKNAGTIRISGEECNFLNPSQAHESGIYLVPQEPKIFPNLSIEENIIIGTSYTLGSKTEEIKKMGQQLGFSESLSRPAGILSIAGQQLLEILRGLLRNVKILILDEPTSTLTFREVESLFKQLRNLKNQGIGVFFISHRINEILEIADRVSVLRDGNFVLDKPVAQLNETTLINAMLPDDRISKKIEETSQKKIAEGLAPLLKIRNLTGEAFNGISFSVMPGEIVGLAGVVGAGRTELAEGIVGIDKNVTGEVIIGNESFSQRSPGRSRKKGIVYVPEDRAAHGIFLDLQNLYTTSSSILSEMGKLFISNKKERQLGEYFIKKLGIKTNGPKQISRTLSGGNQQKIVISRAMACNPKVIILDEPTRGVDAEAREDVYDIIKSLIDLDVGILLISSDLEEVIRLSDRILVMYRGEIIEELSKDESTIERVTSGAFGVAG